MKGVIAALNKKLSVPLARKLKYVEWITPNRVTLLSFFVSGILAPVVIMKGLLPLGGLFVYLGAFLDSLDGDIARERGVNSKEGAIMDAVLDRYADLMLIGSLMLYDNSCLLAGILAMIGSSLVPYIRAKTEAEGKKSVATFGSRDVRNLVMFLGLILSAPCLTLYTLALVSNLSALHRFFHALRVNE